MASAETRWWLPLLLAGMSIGCGVVALAGIRPRRAVRAVPRVADASQLAEAPTRPGMVELAGSLAHELNQPLTAITSNAQAAREYLMSGAADQKEIREILDDIVNDASRASDIVKGVRALIRGEAPRSVPFHVGDVIARALELVREEARTRGVSVQGAVEKALPRAMGDPMEVQLVLLNLLVNALDAVMAVPGHGPRSVSVTVHAHDGKLRLAVRDNGCGVADGDMDKIFRPFFSSKPNGMGIGLSFSRALMERNGGQLRAIRNSDHGMTFECLLRAEEATVVKTHHAAPMVLASRFRTGSSRS